jgi:hypothetical protein
MRGSPPESLQLEANSILDRLPRRNPRPSEMNTVLPLMSKLTTGPNIRATNATQMLRHRWGNTRFNKYNGFVQLQVPLTYA